MKMTGADRTSSVSKRMRQPDLKGGKMRRAIALISLLTWVLLACGVASAQAQTRSLDVYVVDVEGGNATLIVSQPYHESLLIDTGNAGAAAPRDAGRIMEAVKDAGLQQI